MLTERAFPSFWLAGFDCASQIQPPNKRFDLTSCLQHDRHCDADYSMLAPFGMRTVRDGIRWHLIERRPGRFDFSTVEPLRRAAERHGVTVIWDVCHYGCPDGLDLLAPGFAERYARFAGAFARYLSGHGPGPRYYVPINEMSFLAYQAGEIGGFHPFGRARGHEVRCNLVRAAIAGIEAIWEADPGARIVHTEALIHLVAPLGRPDLAEEAARRDEEQFAPLDMLAGRLEPQLGGQPRYLDILGFNFYSYNEADLDGVNLTRADPRWRHLGDLLAGVYARYGRPFFIAETTGEGAGRAEWLEYVAGEAERVLERGLPLQGICLYPITNALDWDTDEYVAFGLWDFDPQPDGTLARVLHEPTAAALRAAQERLRPLLEGEAPGSLGRAERLSQS
jgi:hypothetical protein